MTGQTDEQQMLVQINTDKRIESTEATNAAVEGRIRERLSRFTGRLTRVEMHLRDVDGDRNGSRGIEAKLEARPAGGQPIVVNDQAASVDSAVAGVIRKAVDILDRSFGKLDAVR
ncbi:HPF/RaiA family ribosome-associated protein [Sphingomonas hankookensis]|uniref:Ribosomal subunit interface protein n=1 Tax=Sphingomonas hengshuiensis TaxID=1609977 RepID=A0A2W5BEQ0_9SPHN|nr:MAG: hypothetical protein DI632_04370 [Sphingomonas hengshuiensis]